MKHALCLFLAILLSARVSGETVALVVDTPLAGPAALALADFERALKTKDITHVHRKELRDNKEKAIVVGIGGVSKIVKQFVDAGEIKLKTDPESLCVKMLSVKDKSILVLAGADERGLAYALLDAARSLELAPKDTDPLKTIVQSSESPALRTRAMSVHLFNRDLEEAWYFSEEHWRSYFTMLARDRYNQFTLTFSDQTNYLTPLYPYLVDVPGSKVRVKGLTEGARQRNLDMLKRIAEMAVERGLDFNLGIWAQAPVPIYPGKIEVENLPQGKALAEYCGEALKQILVACPAISGIQFRMNAEAGVSEKEQAEFFLTLFKAIRNCGRAIRLDLRFKGLTAETLAAAIELGFDVTVSIKFWCEHMGLPYHPTVADRIYRESRYSYGNMLVTPRKYRVVYQLWTMGSQRILLWGDPEYAARFAEACHLGGGEGFEVYAPLTNRGYGGQPGAWPLFADEPLRVGKWDFERYWFFYLSFGRMGYNPKTIEEVWKREFRVRFGNDAADIESAYLHASKIVPFITATRLNSASEWWWWPEMDTGGRLAEYQYAQPSDTAQFYAIRTWKKTPDWYWEVWDATIPGYAEDAAKGRVSGKTTPWEIARRLDRYAYDVAAALQYAGLKWGITKELPGTLHDLKALSLLARYHSDKTSAATHLALYETTGDLGRLPLAAKHMIEARDTWRKLVETAAKSYPEAMNFGIEKGNPRSRGGHHHTGTWKDRLPELERDVEYVQELIRKTGAKGEPTRTYPGETGDRPEVTIDHKPLAKATPGTDVPIELKATSKAAIQKIIVHYRPLDQTADWKQRPMTREDGHWGVTIPGKAIQANRDFMYYFEAQYEGGGGRIWPSWKVGQPYIVVPTR